MRGCNSKFLLNLILKQCNGATWCFVGFKISLSRSIESGLAADFSSAARSQRLTVSSINTASVMGVVGLVGTSAGGISDSSVPDSDAASSHHVGLSLGLRSREYNVTGGILRSGLVSLDWQAFVATGHRSQFCPANEAIVRLSGQRKPRILGSFLIDEVQVYGLIFDASDRVRWDSRIQGLDSAVIFGLVVLNIGRACCLARGCTFDHSVVWRWRNVRT